MQRTRFVAFLTTCYLACGTVSIAQHANEITDYTLYHQRRITTQQAMKPFSMRMSRCWDGNADDVRIKLVYADPNVAGGTAAYYLPRDLAYRVDTSTDDVSMFVHVEIHNAELVNMLFIDFVYRVRRDIPCE